MSSGLIMRSSLRFPCQRCSSSRQQILRLGMFNFPKTKSDIKTRTFVISDAKSIGVIFPPFLRLSGISPVETRQSVTSSVSQSITGSGGYLKQSNMLSDLTTTFLIGDLPPEGVIELWSSLEKIPNLKLTQVTLQTLHFCKDLLSQQEETNRLQLPKHIMALFSINWKGAKGDMKHDIIMDG